MIFSASNISIPHSCPEMLQLHDKPLGFIKVLRHSNGVYIAITEGMAALTIFRDEIRRKPHLRVWRYRWGS